MRQIHVAILERAAENAYQNRDMLLANALYNEVGKVAAKELDYPEVIQRLEQVKKEFRKRHPDGEWLKPGGKFREEFKKAVYKKIPGYKFVEDPGHSTFKKAADDFERMIKNKTFKHPETGNKVKFHSLPSDHQSKIRERWNKKKKPQAPIVPTTQAPTTGPDDFAPDMSLYGDWKELNSKELFEQHGIDMGSGGYYQRKKNTDNYFDPKSRSLQMDWESGDQTASFIFQNVHDFDRAREIMDDVDNEDFDTARINAEQLYKGYVIKHT